MCIYSVAEYIVEQLMVGNYVCVEALRLYFVENVSPSDIATKLGVKKHSVRGWVQRIYEKHGAKPTLPRIVEAVIKVAAKSVAPVIVEINKRYAQCTLCKTTMVNDVMVKILHLRTYHKDVLERVAWKVVEAIGDEDRG